MFKTVNVHVLQSARRTKDCINDEVRKVIKTLIDERGPRGEALHGCELTNMLCSCLEALFLHGLRENNKKEKVLWQFLNRVSAEHVTKEIKRQRHLTTMTSFCRAYIRHLLNRPGAPSELSDLLMHHPPTVSQIQKLYQDIAMIRDSDEVFFLMSKADLLQRTYSNIHLRLDHPVLNSWPALTLQLVNGDYSPRSGQAVLATAPVSPVCLKLLGDFPAIISAPVTSLKMLGDSPPASRDRRVVPGDKAPVHMTKLPDDQTPVETTTQQELESETVIRPDDSTDCTQTREAESVESGPLAEEPILYERRLKKVKKVKKPAIATQHANASTPIASSMEDVLYSFTTKFDTFSIVSTISTTSSDDSGTYSGKTSDDAISSDMVPGVTSEPKASSVSMGCMEQGDGEKVGNDTHVDEEAESDFISIYDVEVDEEGELFFTKCEEGRSTVVNIDEEGHLVFTNLQDEQDADAVDTEQEGHLVFAEVVEGDEVCTGEGKEGKLVFTKFEDEQDADADREKDKDDREFIVDFEIAGYFDRRQAPAAVEMENMAAANDSEESCETPPPSQPGDGDDDPHKELRSLLEEEISLDSPAKDTENSEVPKKRKITWKYLCQLVLRKIRRFFGKKPKIPEERLHALREEFLDTYSIHLATPQLEKPSECVVCKDGLEKWEGRLCHFSGQMCCRRCHTNKKAIIPYKIMKDFDFKKYPVCTVAFKHLKETETRVWIEDLCHQPNGKETAFGRNTACIVCLRGNVVMLHWQLGHECGRPLICRQQIRLADVDPSTTPQILRFSVQELMLVKKKKLYKLLAQTQSRQQKHIVSCKRRDHRSQT